MAKVENNLNLSRQTLNCVNRPYFYITSFRHIKFND